VRPISATFAQALQRSHRRVARVSALDSAFVPIPGGVLSGEDGYVIDGSVTIDRRRAVRRTCSLTIANPDGVWTPSVPGDFFYFGSPIRIERGIYLGDGIEWVTLGEFLVDGPIIEHTARGSTLQIQAQDRLKKAATSKFASPTTYAISSTVRSVIDDLAQDAGMGAARMRLDDDGSVLGAARVYGEQEDRLSAMTALAHDFGLELFIDGDGVLVLQKVVDLAALPVAWEFTEGDSAVTLGITKGLNDQRLYNHIVVIGESADQSPVKGEALDDNPASPTYVSGPFGDRTYFYSSAMITTTGQANKVAAARLPDLALIEEEISLPIVVNPALEAGDKIRIVDPITMTDAYYLIDSITIPLGAGSSVVQTKTVRPL